MDWWTFSHGLAFGIGGLLTLAVLLISGWRYCDGRCRCDSRLRARRDRRARGEAVERGRR